MANKIGCVQHDCADCQKGFRIVVNGKDLSFPMLRLLAALSLLFLAGLLL